MTCFTESVAFGRSKEVPVIPFPLLTLEKKVELGYQGNLGCDRLVEENQNPGRTQMLFPHGKLVPFVFSDGDHAIISILPDYGPVMLENVFGQSQNARSMPPQQGYLVQTLTLLKHLHMRPRTEAHACKIPSMVKLHF